jgi:hypothetical protein
MRRGRAALLTLALSYFSTVTTFGTPRDAVLQELRVESFYPADERSAAHRWAWRRAPPG